MPLDIDSYMERCTAEVPQDEIGTTVNALEAQSQGEVTWEAVINANPELSTSLASGQVVDKGDIQSAQRDDPVVAKVTMYFQRGKRPMRKKTARDPPDVVALLRDWEHLSLEDDSWLGRKVRGHN